MVLFHHYFELFYLGMPLKMFVNKYITIHTLCAVYYVVAQQDKGMLKNSKQKYQLQGVD